MKCRVCKEAAIIDLPRHNANFCAEHFLQLCRRQVEKAISEFQMLEPGNRVLVAVSGGKDSLAVWDILNELGFRADGLYVGLGIGDYSASSQDYAEAFARERGFDLKVLELREEFSFDVPTAARATRRVPCSACGLSKRHVFDSYAKEHSYDVVVTGHNLDDEAAVLFGNTLRWDVDYLARQLPVLPSRSGFPKKVKPLIRLTEREMAAWCIVRKIDYIVEECPLAVGNRHLNYKAALNTIEEASPGSKASFYLGFLERMAPLLADRHESGLLTVHPCSTCGAPTGSEDSLECAFCRLRARSSSSEPVSVDVFLAPKSKRRGHSPSHTGEKQS